MANTLNLEKECAEYAAKFMKTAVQVDTPMALADLFYQNSYLRKDLDKNAKIFKKALDLSVNCKCGIYHIIEEKCLLEDIYKLAFADYAKKNGLIKDEEADKFVKSIVDLI
jgi:hypothetical protein